MLCSSVLVTPPMFRDTALYTTGAGVGVGDAAADSPPMMTSVCPGMIWGRIKTLAAPRT